MIRIHKNLDRQIVSSLKKLRKMYDKVHMNQDFYDRLD